jgi:MFS family permease
MTWRDSIAPLRNKNFAWYYASRFSDTLGTMMAGIALTFAVLDITDSATALGQVLAAHFIPLVVFLLLGGVIADRVPRTLLIQGSNLAAAATQGLLAALVITDSAELWMVIVLTALNGTADAISFPAQSSMVPQLVERGQLQSANALLSLSRGGLTVIGPSVSALMVVTVGPGYALAINAVMWLLSAALLAPVDIPPPAPKAERTSTLQDLREGWRLFIGTTWLWVVVLSFSLLNMIHMGAWFTLGPVVAKDTIGEQGWGFVLSAGSAGLLLMTVVLLRVRLRRPLFVGMLGCALLSIPLVMLGVRPELVALVLAAFLAGAGIEVFSIGWNLAMQENIDDRMLSRAYSYDALGSFVAGSDLTVRQAFGPIFEEFGVQVAFTGHEHMYERTVPWRVSTDRTRQAVTYFVAGGGGARLYPAGLATWTAFSRSYYQYLRVNVDGCVMTTRSIDRNGSAGDTFTLDRCAQALDASNPTVRVTAPADGARVSGTITISASASDDVRVEKVDFFVDGVLKAVDRTASYSYAWNSASVPAGSHEIQARAYDIAGNRVASTTITVVTTGS